MATTSHIFVVMIPSDLCLAVLTFRSRFTTALLATILSLIRLSVVSFGYLMAIPSTNLHCVVEVTSYFVWVFDYHHFTT